MTSLFHHIYNAATLVTSELSIVRGDDELFAGVSMTLKSGDVLWMQGDNGIGKTTLLEALAGLNRPDSGKIKWSQNGQPCKASDIVAYQAHRDYAKPSLTTQEDLSFWGTLHGNKVSVAKTLNYVGLANKSSIPTQKLSAGQRRRLALAKLIISQKPIWIMDEPDAALDTEGTNLIDTLVKAHIARGGSAIIASHNPARHLSKNTRKLTLRAST